MNNLNLRSLGLSVRVLFTGYLTVVGVGYLMALVQILMTHGMADGKFGLSLDDIVYSYYGNRTGTLIEKKLTGSMMDMADEHERATLIQWARDGGQLETFESSGVKDIFENNCSGCHAGEGPGPGDFTTFENIKPLAETDTGATYQSLTRVSHIHLFGIAFVFMFVGLIFSLSTGLPAWLKSSLIAMPYVFLLADIGSWWLTRFTPNGAYLVFVAGVGMALAFATMWLWSVYQMWIAPEEKVIGSGWQDD